MENPINTVSSLIAKRIALILASTVLAVVACAVAPALNTGEHAFATKAYAYTGWDEDGEYWYYYNDGVPASGWQDIYHAGEWDSYYFINGVMQTGWLVWDGDWFYLADWNGQGVGFSDDDYGVCRFGWEKIYHSGRWDEYHFRDGGSGRMDTNWFDYDGHTYYLSGSEIGTDFYSSDYGTMVVDFQDIGRYKYYFKNEEYTHGWPIDPYWPHGAMLRDISGLIIANHGIIIGYADIDKNGHVDLLQVLDEETDRPVIIDGSGNEEKLD